MHRRTFITASCGCVLALVDGARSDGAQWPRRRPGSSGEPQGGNGGERVVFSEGCSLSARAEQGQTGGPRMLRSSGVPQVDQQYRVAYDYFQQAFQVSPDLAFFDDSGAPNAFATSDRLVGRGQGTVGVGTTLVTLEVQSNPSTFGSSLGTVLAHEFGHISQYSRRVDLPGKFQELHADFLAGWVMGVWVAASRDATPNAISAAQALFEKGDYHFNDPDHHGTPLERSGAFTVGYGAAVQRGVQSIDQAFPMGLELIGA